MARARRDAKAATQRKILAAGRAVFAEQPYDDASMDAVARRAEVSKALVHHYFGTKRALYVAVLRSMAEHFLEGTAPDPSEPPRARAESGIRRYLDFVEAHPRAFAALVRGGVGSSDGEVRAIVDELRERIVARIQRRLGNDEPHPVLDLFLRGYLGAMEAISLRWIDGGTDRETVAAVAHAFLEAAVLRSLAMDPASVPELGGGRLP